MQQLIAEEIECAKEGHVSYKIEWTIPNWAQVRQDVRLVKNQKAMFKTGSQSTQVIQTKWLVGLKSVPVEEHGETETRVRLYWQLLDIKGSGAQVETKLEVEMVSTLLSQVEETVTLATDDRVYRTVEEISLYDTIEETNEYLDVGANVQPSMDDEYIDINGAVDYELILTLKNPVMKSSQFKKLKLEQFSKRSHVELRETLATLLNENSDGDLRIMTSDGFELTAHQNILKAQCPMFAGMLNSNLSESKTGIVKVEDISGKTMKIILHYFYTGDLLTGWNDPDTILEFTYAAGKYQLTRVLKLLDDLFGTNDEDEVSNLDLQLLSLTGKLSLENAEKRLLQRVIGKISKAESGEKLFQLFGYDSEEIIRNAKMMAGEQVEESKVLEILEYAFGNGNSNQEHEEFSRRGLILLALVQRNGSLKILEQTLLKRFAEITSRFTTAEELFALFGDCK